MSGSPPNELWAFMHGGLMRLASPLNSKMRVCASSLSEMLGAGLRQRRACVAQHPLQQSLIPKHGSVAWDASQQPASPRCLDLRGVIRVNSGLALCTTASPPLILLEASHLWVAAALGGAAIFTLCRANQAILWPSVVWLVPIAADP